MMKRTSVADENDAGAESQQTYWLAEVHERNTAHQDEYHERNSFTVAACNQLSVAYTFESPMGCFLRNIDWCSSKIF